MTGHIRPQVEKLIQFAGAGESVEVLQAFYAGDAATREPDAQATLGKLALVAKEEAFLSTVAK